LHQKYNTRDEALQAFYGHEHQVQQVIPPLLQPLNPPFNEAHGGQVKLRDIIVIILVITLVVGFIVWKMM
jgi:hypothetical protein